MYNSDSAIKTKDQDLLGRAGFAADLANAILNSTGKESVVVGLYGSWGCGKTSLVNLVIEEIKNLTRDSDDKPLIINFEPWYFSSEENLVSAYFKTLRLSLNIGKNNIWKVRIGEALDNYADAWDALNFVPGAGPILAPALKAVTRTGGKKLSKVQPIDKAKKSIEKAMLEHNGKIIVVIDDIDRLDNAQIRAVFQLVKQIASFPNTTYILPMAREIVARALIDVQGSDGNSYLEKIVQIPFVIPELSNTKLQKVFFDKLDAVLRMNNITSIDEKYWSSIFYGCVWPYVKNLRDVNRVVNTLQFKVGFLCGELCVEDLIAMTTIDVLDPSLFSWIGENREMLCGNVGAFTSYYREKNAVKLREKYTKSMQDAGVKNIDRAIVAVASLFPHFANEIEQHISYQGTNNIKKEMRVAELKRATLLFDMDKDNIKIPRNIIMDTLLNYSQKDFGDFLNTTNIEGCIVYYLDEINALLDEIPDSRLIMIIKELWKRSKGFKGSSTSSIFVISAELKAAAIVDKLIEKLPSNQDRYKLFTDILKNADINEMESMGERINTIELAYGRLAGKGHENKQEQVLDINHVESLESEFAKRAKAISDSEAIFAGHKLFFFTYLWEAFDKAAFSKFIEEHFADDKFMLRFICRLAGKWSGTAGEGWSFNSSNYSSYISTEDIYRRISEYDKKQMNRDFDDEELLRIASFYLNYGKDELREHATISEARKLIDSWKK